MQKKSQNTYDSLRQLNNSQAPDNEANQTFYRRPVPTRVANVAKPDSERVFQPTVLKNNYVRPTERIESQANNLWPTSTQSVNKSKDKINYSDLKQEKYIYGFDGLRAIALIFVLLYHWFPTTIKGGYLGVVAFFTLSGYLVTDRLLSLYQLNSSFSVADFYQKRLKKLYPPLLFFLLALSTWVVLFQRNTLYNYRSGFLSVLFGYNNIWQIISQASYFEQFTQINFFTHIWTLAVEIQFYLLWPWLIILLAQLVPKNKLRASFRFFGIVLTLAGALWMMISHLSGASINRVYFGTDTRAFSLFLGATLAAFLGSKKIKQISQIVSVQLLNYISIALTIFMLLFLFTLSGESSFLYNGGMLIFNILLVALMPIVACPDTVIGKFMKGVYFSVIARRSYALYLWQYPIMTLSYVSLKGLDIPYGASFLFQVIALILISEITYQITEKPTTGSFYLFSFLNPSIKSTGKKILAMIMVALMSLSTLVAFILAPSDLPEDIKELQARLQENKNKGNNIADIKTEEDLKNSATDESKKDSSTNQPAENGKENNQSEQAKASLEPRTFANKEYLKALEEHLPVKLDKVGESKDFSFAIAEEPSLALTELERHLAPVLPAAIVGDSVLLGSKPEVSQILPNTFVDGEVSRQFAAGANIIDQLASVKKLPKTIVLALGTNGVISAAEVNSFAEKYKDHTIFLVNTVVNNQSEEIANNAIADALKNQPNTVLIDWHSLAKTKVAWFASDNVHPSVDGRSIYAQLIAKSVLSYYINKADEKVK